MTAVAWVVSVALALVARAQSPTFRARTDLVRIDVLVTRDGEPLSGLTAGDFEVLDNGVVQNVASVSEITTVRLGVVLDASGSMTGDRLLLARSAIARLVDQLQPSDTLAVIATGDQVGRVAAPGASKTDVLAAVERIRAEGSTALIDGIYGGLIETGEREGPKLLIVLTDGRNNASWMRGADIVDLARQRETAIYTVGVGVMLAESTAPPSNPLAGVAAGSGGGATTGSLQETRGASRGAPTTHPPDNLALLRVLADKTGGRHLAARWDESLEESFTRVLAEYRQRYILTFSPETPAPGWHALQIRVKRRGLTVRARDGYWGG